MFYLRDRERETGGQHMYNNAISSSVTAVEHNSLLQRMVRDTRVPQKEVSK